MISRKLTSFWYNNRLSCVRHPASNTGQPLKHAVLNQSIERSIDLLFNVHLGIRFWDQPSLDQLAVGLLPISNDISRLVRFPHVRHERVEELPIRAGIIPYSVGHHEVYDLRFDQKKKENATKIPDFSLNTDNRKTNMLTMNVCVYAMSVKHDYQKCSTIPA